MGTDLQRQTRIGCVIPKVLSVHGAQGGHMRSFKSSEQRKPNMKTCLFRFLYKKEKNFFP